MRILHCLRAPVGGLFRHVLDLAGEQAKYGHDVGMVVDSTSKNALSDRLLAEVAPGLALGISEMSMSRKPGIGDLAVSRAVTAHARPMALDVLHGHGAKGGAYARLARRALRREGQPIKAFYTPHGGTLNFKPGTLQSRVFLAIEQQLEKFTDGIIFESAYAARVYRERVGNGAAAKRVIPNGLQPADFLPPVPDESACRDVLYVGELRNVKGVNHLLAALANLRNRGVDVTATIVGSGPDEAALKQQARQLGLYPHIAFTGALPIRTALRLGRIMVVPSLAESFPYVVLEAAAAGLPLISTNVGGIPEIVAGTDTALIPAADPAALDSAICAALDDPHGARERAERLKKNVATKFTVASMTEAVLDFYAFTNS